MLPSQISTKFLWGLLLLHMIFGAIDVGVWAVTSGVSPSEMDQRQMLDGPPSDGTFSGFSGAEKQNDEDFLGDNTEKQKNLFDGIASFANSLAQGFNMAAGSWTIFKRAFFWDYSFMKVGGTVGSVLLYGQIFMSVVFAWIILGLIIQKFWAR